MSVFEANPGAPSGEVWDSWAWAQEFSTMEASLAYMFDETIGNTDVAAKSNKRGEDGSCWWLSDYNPIILNTDPDGNSGEWEVYLSEEVSKPAPEMVWVGDMPLIANPPTCVTRRLTVFAKGREDNGTGLVESIERPCLELVRDKDGNPMYVLSDESEPYANLYTVELEMGIALGRRQLRYAKWLILACEAAEVEADRLFEEDVPEHSTPPDIPQE